MNQRNKIILIKSVLWAIFGLGLFAGLVTGFFHLATHYPSLPKNILICLTIALVIGIVTAIIYSIKTDQYDDSNFNSY